ncbi:hypothetical protein [Neorhizobium galegae]|uniref:hypothetical protein n=1 Tax=Neorhizobium galegae TaxID=399 RepID=UPI000621A106|nr:hypothetical protein [Neorhizobium galegae]CDZ55053.1 Hypothetical protein NGAL_HAMBI2427_59650 [Neorhizobium galegae bv. orientalis]
MERFHIIDDAAAILITKGVYRQAKVYRRGGELFAAYGSGFIRLYRNGTSLPNVRCEDVETPGWHQSFDAFGKLSVHQ